MHPAQIVVRPLSSAQAATRQRLLQAARDLADQGGYDAAGVRAVAEHAGLSAPTAYQYFLSKDHLLVDALIDLVDATTASLTVNPSRGPSSVERVARTLRRAVGKVEEHPNLYRAMTRAYIAGSVDVAHARGAMESTIRTWIDHALGESTIDDRDGVIAILEQVMFASMVGLVTGGLAPGDVADSLERAARLLLAGRVRDDGRVRAARKPRR